MCLPLVHWLCCRPWFLGQYSISSRVWSIISSLSLSRSSTTSVRINESGSTLLLYYFIGHRSLALIAVMEKNRKFMVCKLLTQEYIVCRYNELTGQLEQVSNVLPNEIVAQEDANFRNDITEPNK